MLGSAEVGTLITALGCGIGREEFNPDKLRYHRIIIMTDADVDGSHIRTLLLTFFYRQMPELIERGHVYIGLPPLYKLKQGKQELYLKDDAALNAYLISHAVEGAELVCGDGQPAVSASALEHLLSLYGNAQDAIRRLSHRHDPAILEALLELPPLTTELFADASRAHAWIVAAQHKLARSGLGKPRYALNWVAPDGDQGAALRVQRQHHGLSVEQLWPLAVFESGELKPVVDAARELHDLLQQGARVSRGSRSQPVLRFADVHHWLFEEAKRGRTIQRFKGLGEMNPDQLWETTVNPETRRLLRVRIEDAVAADQIFSTLMGDVVEPRRDFIEDNALKVANLDI
jgi:DNA gyrase subunit B